YQGPRILNIEAENPWDILAPSFSGMVSEILSGFEADAIVVDAKERGAQMGHFDRNQRDACDRNLVSYDRRRSQIDLKLNHQIYTFSNESFCIPQSSLSVIL